MIKALEEGKISIIVNMSSTISRKQIRWNNAGLVFKDSSFYEQDLSKYDKKIFTNLEELKRLFPSYFQNKSYDEIFRYLTPRECWALQGFNVSFPKYQEYSNFYTIPRSSDGKLINGQYNRIWKLDKHVGTISASLRLKFGFTDENGNLIFRELTPQETWLLQGYSLSQYDKVKAAGISDNDMYALAGNSICVPVLEAIFKELLIDKKSNSNKYFVKRKQNEIKHNDN